ncbi:MAG: hypothetical protein D6710_05155 [Nitrospirae bacterium]|nr:MAG: hypothetical protein D6710_05155 [Nitrospirota bacterium]
MVPATAVVAWILVGRAERAGNDRSFYLSVYSVVRKVFVFSLFWLMIGAVPRVLTFRFYELREAELKGIVVALFAKLLLAFMLVLTGSVLWIKIGKRLKQL